MAGRSCVGCGRPLEADASSRVRYCQRADCRRERARARQAKCQGQSNVVELPQHPNVSLADTVRETLGDRIETWEGRAALLLAERIDAAEREAGSAFAALVAKLETSMELAQRPRPGESFVDELRRRRAQRASGG